ncbi:MAG: sugar phosphate isomerase/epimerase, partial [Gammaproteobacteria bacterium]|nr:sugar phosphate isomerase/epimerase [Gammaproteobacteria bacterium]
APPGCESPPASRDPACGHPASSCRKHITPRSQYEHTYELISNERYGATALIHTHGGLVGGAVWDTWLVLRDFDPDCVGINFDTGYGFYIAGAGWREAVRFARPYIGLISLKDFRWKREAQNGRSQWGPEICAPGQGMVDFQEMLSYFKSTDFHGPAEVQFEYPIPVPGRSASINLMTRDVGEWTLEMPKSAFIAVLQRDVDFYATLMRETGLQPAC